MGVRLQWNEIQGQYPDQWGGLKEVEWDGSTVISAIVRYTDRTRGELIRMQIDDNSMYSCYS